MKKIFAMIVLWLQRVYRATFFPHEMNVVFRSTSRIKIHRANPIKIFSLKWFREGDCLREVINALFRFDRFDYGVVSRKMVTTQGVRWLADLIAADGTAAIGTLIYHNWGTGTNAEAVTDTTLQTPTAPTTNGGAGNIAGTSVSSTVGSNAKYTSVATIVATVARAITEIGISYKDLTEDGGIFDRSVFAAKNVVNGDSITHTYELTINSGG